MTLTAKDSGAAVTAEADADFGARGTAPPPIGPPVNGNPGQILRLVLGLVVITGIFVAAGLGDLLIFIVIIVVIVMLHELAHFITAKWAHMKVTEYFVGFGPRIWSFRHGETEYGVKALPLGGYVRITGFTVLDDVAADDEPFTYRQQPFWKRIIVASAGSAMHFFIALVLALIAVFTWGVASNNQTIISLDHWSGVAHTPAQLAGLKPGDTVVSFDGRALTSPLALHDDISAAAGRTVTLGVEHNGHVTDVTVTPRDGRGIKSHGTYLASPTAKKAQGFIGIVEEPATVSAGFLGGIGDAADNVGSATREEVLGIGRLFSASGLGGFFHQVVDSKAAAKAAKSPSTDIRPVSLIGIANLGVQAQQQGLYWLLELLIAINVVFGMLNMLPMLPLDGGHVAVAVYEWIRTKKGQAYYRADITKLFPVVAVFLAFLGVIVVSALYLDITHPL
jgi:membrane-associated protease RseP (regulator of RpoE activity)